MLLQRALSPLERALLQAIVELGEEAYGVAVRRHVEKATGKFLSVGNLYVTANRLEEEGFIRSFEGKATTERGWRKKLYWRPVFDLTEVLKPCAMP